MTRTRVEEPRSRLPAWPGCAHPLRLQVLLVDDEIDQLLPLADVLRRAGLAPTIATSVDEAEFEVRMSPPDVVVVDAELADRNLLARLRTMVSTLPVVLMSPDARPDAIWRAMLAIAGVVYVEKPVDARRLVELLSDASRFPKRSAPRS